MASLLGETITLPEDLFALLSELIRQHLGLEYPPDKRSILQDRLYPLLVEEGMDSFFDLYYLLKYNGGNETLWKRVQSALAVRETYFWREVDQILAAANYLIPALQAEAPGRTVRVWHAACASGEEPYSLAMALSENGAVDWERLEIIGTDFDETSLNIARRGVYGMRSFRVLPAHLREKYFTEVQSQHFQIHEKFLKKVQFKYLNLMDEAGMQGMQDFDFIFCRNVFIYFDIPSITRTAQHFYEALRNPGYLFLGAAESLLRIPTRFELRELHRAFVYVKQEKEET
ncbi:CheR family methyltransferase [Anaerolinea thermophila]|uniref:protein-glutamate O-methyltransferase n=1 Tax=Anaerolinea thermophila (strain DSM 14523 / JCM 11388 / NBRC 100420 / UNI-1) TaxID=926569 RepID=E8N2Z2_ANATU|nr:protein-glutamate O-methyltransferase CheR [Anaerolinea thermophila]BAJ65142.1 chemotaxis protein methyltransferase [Anaerolinea thermophila UNI-1]